MKYQRGALTIEAAFVLPILMFIVFHAVELSRLMITYAALEHAVAKAARHAKLSLESGHYAQQLLASFNLKQPLIIDADKINVKSVSVYPSVHNVLNGTEMAGTSLDFVQYQVHYDFVSISPLFGQMTLQSLIMVKHEN